MNYKYLFGPVRSRRLGISLGIDLIPFKTCTLNCVYCECGKTDNFTMTRKEYIPLSDLFEELNDYLKNSPKLDYITFSGSGEPTLHSGIGTVINFIKSNYPEYKTAVLTNGSLLNNKTLQNDLINADIVIPSLDAVSDDAFMKINKPCKGLKNSEIIDGLKNFSKLFKGSIWIEIFIVPGINDTDDELKLFKKVLKDINAEKIQLNSLDRPGTESWVQKADDAALLRIRDFLKPLKTEIISKSSSAANSDIQYKNEDSILSILKRRPSTADDIKAAVNLADDKLESLLNDLISRNLIEISLQDRGKFYKIK